MNFRKRILKRMNKWEPKEQVFTNLPDGGYSTYHPTKGLRVVSGRRLRAQAKMAELYGFIR